MKLIAIKGNLKEGISTAERACGENLHLPILKNILIEAAGEKISLTATNLELAITYTVAGKVIEEGKLTVPAGLLSNLIGSLSGERLNLETKKTILEIKTDNNEAIIQGLEADDYPLIPKIKNLDKFIEIKGDLLKEALEQTIPSAQNTDARPELNSILFNYTLDDLKMVGTDAARLSEKTISSGQINSNLESSLRFLLPLKTAQELVKIIKDEDTVRFYNDPNQVLIKTDRFECVSRLIDGNFPDYTAIIPKKFEAEVLIDKEDLVNALKVAGIFTSRVNETKIKISENKKNIEIFAGEQSVGENNCVIPVKVQGNAKEVSFNWKFLNDGLKAVKSKEVFMGLTEDNKPALIKASADSSFFYVLMPIMKA